MDFSLQDVSSCVGEYPLSRWRNHNPGLSYTTQCKSVWEVFVMWFSLITVCCRLQNRTQLKLGWIFSPSLFAFFFVCCCCCLVIPAQEKKNMRWMWKPQSSWNYSLYFVTDVTVVLISLFWGHLFFSSPLHTSYNALFPYNRTKQHSWSDHATFRAIRRLYGNQA